jgi:hypothetical protein
MTDTTMPMSPPAPWAAAPHHTAGQAVAALVLAIVGWFVLPIIGPIIALVLASGAKKAIAASNGTLGGRGLAVAAQVVAWVSLAVWVLVIGAIVSITFLGARAEEKFQPVGTNLDNSSYEVPADAGDATVRGVISAAVYMECDNVGMDDADLVDEQVAALSTSEIETLRMAVDSGDIADYCGDFG